MNTWFERLNTGLEAELAAHGSFAEVTTITPGEIEDLLQLAGDAARTSGARQYAPIATYIAGRLVEQLDGSDEARRRELIGALSSAVKGGRSSRGIGPSFRATVAPEKPCPIAPRANHDIEFEEATAIDPHGPRGN